MKGLSDAGSTPARSIHNRMYVKISRLIVDLFLRLVIKVVIDSTIIHAIQNDNSE